MIRKIYLLTKNECHQWYIELSKLGKHKGLGYFLASGLIMAIVGFPTMAFWFWILSTYFRF